jgi:hypothetical protein
MPWREWIELRGISLSTAERLQRDGLIQVTYISKARKGVTASADRAYLAACARGRA